MDYARVVDIHEWYGDKIDWDKVNVNFDVVGIRAGVGTYQDKKLGEYIQRCKDMGKAYFTYHIPTSVSYGATIERQVELYLSWPGVKDAVRCFDIEPPFRNGSYMVSRAEALRYIGLLGDTSNVMWYSNQQYIHALGWPEELAAYNNWVATYYYAPGTDDQFETFEEFLGVWNPENLPVWLRNSIYANSCLMWQFTSQGDALYYISMPGGITNCDLSLSCKEKARVMSFFVGQVEPPAPGDEVMGTFKCVVNGAYQNVRKEHNINSQIVGAIYKNEIVEATEVWSDGLGNVWVKVKPTSYRLTVSGWAAIVYSRVVYLVGI